nr:MAG TPA: Exonuclease [Caudoviricetes sp.]
MEMKWYQLRKKAIKQPLKPGSPEWMKKITASKVAAILKVSPYTSKYALWHIMKGNIEGQAPTREVAQRGHILEDAIAKWYTQQHPEYKVLNPHGLAWSREVITATPDRIIVIPEAGKKSPEVVALLECKTAMNGAEWGASGSGADGIPLGYYAQVQAQMFCTGIKKCVVAALIAMQFREYTIEYDEQYVDRMSLECSEFAVSLESDIEPIFSEEEGDMSIYEAVRELHPEIDDTLVVASNDAAVRIERFQRIKKLYKQAEAIAKNWAVIEMGRAVELEYNGRPIAKRQARGTGKPFVVFK